MKKFLFTLVTVLVSIYAWAASLNPYAYNLRGTYNKDRQELTVSFTLNAHPNMDASKGGTGIQIFAINPNDHNERYYIFGVPSNDITDNISKGTYNYGYTFHIPSKELDGDRLLPTNKELTWAIRVQGENTIEKGKQPQLVNNLSDDNRPFSCHGIAIQKCQDREDFGHIYVTEASNGNANYTWSNWLSTKGKSLLKYTPRLKCTASYRKSQNFSDRHIPNRCLEPHRVRISDDGRIFVSSYNYNSASGKPVVWEFVNDNYTPIIYNNTTTGFANGTAPYGHRACGMDVKGKGDDIKILLCYLYEYTGGTANSINSFEYDISDIKDQNTVGTSRTRYRFRGTIGDSQNVREEQDIVEWARKSYNDQTETNRSFFYGDGLANICYGANNPNDIFLAMDFFYTSEYPTRLVYFPNVTNYTEYAANNLPSANTHLGTSDGHHFGGGSLLTYMEGSTEYIVSGRCNVATSNRTDSDGRIQVYKLDKNSSTQKIATTATYTISTPTNAVINDMAMDCANNLYAVSFHSGVGNLTGGTGRIVAIAMPYDGKTITVAPNKAIAATNTEPAHQASFRLTPLALSHEDTNLAAKLQNQTATVEVTRPLQSESFNTICLPFALTTLTGTPYEGASVKKFVGVTYSNESEEELLYLSFEDVTFTGDDYMYAGTPYLILPNGDIHAAVRFYDVTLSATTKPIDYEDVNFVGVLAKQALDAGKLIVVANNQLAENTGGEINGLRAYFTLNQTKNVKAKLSFRRPTATDIDNISTKDIDVEKFLREGRVYIRMGEDLYTINGEKVE